MDSRFIEKNKEMQVVILISEISSPVLMNVCFFT